MPKSVSIVLTIIAKELREFSRDPWSLMGWGILFVATVIACWKGSRDADRLIASQSAQQQAAREEWLNQTTANAHMATHHGTSVMKVVSPLFSLDPGIDRQLGTAVRVESHKQGEFIHPPGGDAVRVLKLEMSSPALMLQGIFPLFVILLGFSGVSREREQGTLRLLMGFGTSWRMLFMGKLATLLLVIGLISLPQYLLSAWTLVRSGADMEITNLVGREFLFWTVSWLYLAGWAALTLAVSARVSSSRTALIILLGLWACWTIILPRIAIDVAHNTYPLPRVEEIRDVRAKALQHTDGGSEALRKHLEDFDRKLLAEHGVNRIRDLPISYAGAKLLAIEQFNDGLLDDLQAKLNEVSIRQDRVVEQFEWCSPFLAVRSASMTLAGTDRRHHEAFAQAADRYRRQLVKTMNTADMQRQGPGESPNERRAFWGRVPAFTYQFPGWRDALRVVEWPLLILIVWCLGTIILLFLSRPRQFS